MYRKILALLGALGLMFGMAACSAPEVTPESLPTNAVIVDVRSPEEYGAGHLEGADLLDLNSGQFAQTVPSLDPEATYVLYCRSGNRSGQAAKILRDAGFTNVVDLGSMASAQKATGLPVVTD